MKVKRTRELKKFNGRFRDHQHIYIGAYSINDASEILKEAYGVGRSCKNEINVYFNKSCWGNPMEGIELERGAWVQGTDNDKPKRII